MLKELIISSRGNIIVMLLIISMMSILLTMSDFYRAGAKESKQLVNDSLQKALAKYTLAKNNTEILKQYKARYIRLKEKGHIEVSDRLSWVNAMEASVNNNLITSVQYKIDKQIKYSDSGLARAYPNITIFKSSMVVQMEMMHEGDLYAFFDYLKNNAKGFFEIKRCEINASVKTFETILDTFLDSNLKASCRINWYSLKFMEV